VTTPISLLRQRLRVVEERFGAYANQAANNGGRLKRHEVWRRDYLAFPYLLGAPNERVAQRFVDVFMNTTELDTDAKLVPLPVDTADSFMQKFTHLTEEYGTRGGVPLDIIEKARKPALAYFANGEPIATRMFRGYTPPTSSFVVKYGRREFLEPMLHTGRLRICPATYYNDSSHNAAVKDDEIHRTFFIPTFQERLKGVHHIDFQGHRIRFDDDDIVLPIVAPDYFLFSLCDHIYYRMPTDFHADAALIIRNPDHFAQRVISSFLARWPDWNPVYGPVTYYDPYRDYTKMRVHEMSKHFGYSYQREARIVLRARGRLRAPLQPEFLDIGPMTGYADLVYA
jgi:hypothetical protein